ncbi:MAG: FAD:protein FMN transferase [Chloroflexi bacterium]|nr:FAD:protein FMN transferase [Chloroflexota bacterium]
MRSTPAPRTDRAPRMAHRAFPAMNTDIDLRLWPAPKCAAAARRALARAAAFVRTAEARLSRFDPASEIARLNRGERGPVSPLTYRIVAAALASARATGGLFDPTVYGVLLAAGYDRSFPALKEGAASAPVEAGRLAGRYRDVALDPHTRTIRLPPGVGLDLGGIAKGWLADAVARRLGRHGAALADLGGDIAVAGAPPGCDGWEVEVADPDERGRPLVVLCLRSGGVATSGVLRRRWQTDQGWQHHLIDPRTGLPARTDLSAVTVVAPTATAAEVAAKAALLLGSAAGQRALESSPGLAGLLVQRDGTVRTTEGFDAYLSR